MNIKLLLIIFIGFFLVSCTSNNQEIVIDPQCAQRAAEVVPEQVVLSFDKAFNGYDDQELYYVLESITWSDGHNNQVDRAFRKPTIAGLDNRFYYPLDKDTKLDSSWSHTGEITYSNSRPFFSKYTFELTLAPTDIFSYGRSVNQLSGLPEDDISSGTRVFSVVDSNIVFCDDDSV
jgi:hypothetical protein